MNTKLTDVAVALAHAANKMCSGDPREPFVALMTAAAFSGYILERTPEQLHEMLDKVHEVALAKLLQITDTKQ